jgi:signal transduction histidine kinase
LGYQARTIIENHITHRFSKNVHRDLQDIRKEINLEGLQFALSNAISSYAAKNSGLIRVRQREYNDVLYRYTEWVMPRLEYLEKRIRYFASIGLGLSLLLLGTLAFYVQNKILTPLKKLTVKMNDFLYDRYTYQFLIPENNEVGEIQATFNSLAQRVLSNMDQLRTLDEAKSEFLSIASHELRTPLTAIKGSLNLLSNQTVGPLDSKSLKLVQIADAETDRLIRLINDLLDITRIEAGRLPLRRTWFDLNEVFHSCAISLAPLVNSAKLNLEVEELASDNIEVLMDRDRLVQVLSNLLSNAIKFSPAGSSIRIRAIVDPMTRELRVEVEDQGRGIPPQDLELIFQKFRQSTSLTNPLVKGTGLGLAIAKALIEEHGGTIGVVSKPNIGSRFYFLITDWRLNSTSIVRDAA